MRITGRRSSKKLSRISLLCFALVLAGSGSGATAESIAMPLASVTPGAINPAVTPANISKTICKSGWTATIRPSSSYTDKIKRSQLNGSYSYYGDATLGDFEEDHLISLELGGSPTSVLNLWPEPYAGSTGARVKDKVETKLKTLVCSGKVGLRTAQAAISSDWYSAYRLYILGESATSAQTPEPTQTVEPTVTASPTASATPVVSPTPTPSVVALPTATATPTPVATPAVISTPTPVATPTLTSTPTPTPTATTSTSTNFVTPGAFCSPSGATGVSAKGVSYTCKTSATDSRLRWRQ